MPDEPFPKTNNPAGFELRVEQWFAANKSTALRNLGLLSATIVAITAGLLWKLAPNPVEGSRYGMQ